MGGPLRLGGGVPSDFTPVITLTTISDQDDLSAMTVSLNTVTIGGVTKTPSSVAFRVNGATTGLADPTAVGGTTFTPTRGGEYTIGGTVTIDGVTYAITPQTRTVGQLRYGIWWVAGFYYDFSDSPAIDVAAGGAGTYTFAGAGIDGSDVDVSLDPQSATTFSYGGGYLTINGAMAGIDLALTDLLATWDDSMPVMVEAVFADDTYTGGEYVTAGFIDADGSERERVLTQLDGATLTHYASKRVAGTFDRDAKAVASKPFTQRVTQLTGNCWRKTAENATSIGASPEMDSIRSRARDDHESANSQATALMRLTLGAAANQKRCSHLSVWFGAL